MDNIYRYSLAIDGITVKYKEMKEQVEESLESSKTRPHVNKYISMEPKYRNILIIFDKNDNITDTASTP